MSIISQRLYNEVMMSDDFTCVYCGKRTPDVQVDHIIPQSFDGPNVLHNLVAACPMCNIRKGNRQLHEVGMQLRFGRFTYPMHEVARRQPLPYATPIAQRGLLPDERTARIAELAIEKEPNGRYCYSANAIFKMVGGARQIVLSQISTMRG